MMATANLSSASVERACYEALNSFRHQENKKERAAKIDKLRSLARASQYHQGSGGSWMQLTEEDLHLLDGFFPLSDTSIG